MKKILVISFLLIFTCHAWALNIDLSTSQSEVKDSQTIRVHNVTVEGMPGKFWADFQWDPVNLVMVPIAAGEETSPSAVGTWAVTFDWTCDGNIDTSSYWTLSDDGSLASSTGMTASWQLQNNAVSIFFDAATSYFGTLGADGNTITGTVESSITGTGCWSATRSASVNERTWNIPVLGSSTSYNITLTSKPNHTFEITLQPSTGNPWICMTIHYKIIQGNFTFDFSSVTSDANTARVAFTGGWDGCNYIYQGQVISGTISDVPTWFDFNSQFGLAIDSDFIFLYPDGSVHR